MEFHAEIESGDRFQFGENWKRFLSVLTEERIAEAEHSLREMLEKSNLENTRFLDIGCGSGLFSLAARRLGASVHSLDYDPQSVACTLELRSRFFQNDPNWKIEAGNALDETYLKSLGQFDIVYSWGVLHHTGAMWQALRNVDSAVAPKGLLFIAIYNDQGVESKLWRKIKSIYNRVPSYLKTPYVLLIMGPRELLFAFYTVITRGPGAYIKIWTEYAKQRGMSRWHDFVDWMGGYPFEVAMPEEIIAFYRHLGYTLVNLRTVRGRIGCNQYVFLKSIQ